MIYVVFQKMIRRNEENGVSSFTVFPKTYIKEAKNGILLCEGKIGAFIENTPLSIEGYIGEHGIFHCSYIAPSGSTEDFIRLFLGDKIEQTEINAIKRCVGEDILSFAKEKDAMLLLKTKLASFDHGAIHAGRLLRGCESLQNHQELLKIFIELGIPLDVMYSIVKHKFTLDDVKKNPFNYKLGLSIFQSEALALYFFPGFDPYDKRRFVGYVTDALNIMLTQGSTCCPLEDVIQIIRCRIKKSPLSKEMISAPLIYMSIETTSKLFTIKENDRIPYVYYASVYEKESITRNHFLRLEKAKMPLLKEIPLHEVEEEIGFTYNPGQRKAFELLHTSGLKVVTGGPGTGKTALIKGLIRAYRKSFPKNTIRLMATTGAASQVLKRASEMKATTVHKGIGIRPGNMRPTKNENEPLSADFLIIDECSMLDLETCHALIQAIKSGTLVVLVGDIHQLQSVGYGDVLNDIIHCGKFEVYYLTEVMRQDKESSIISLNARKVNEGRYDLETNDHFHIYHCVNEEDAKEHLVKNLPSQQSLVLSPVKKGEVGVEIMNRLTQPKNGKFCFEYGEDSFYVGDLVIMTQTDYEAGFFNGDVGRITAYKSGEVTISLFDGEVSLQRENFSKFKLAYCRTIHKSQGSEEESVHILLPEKMQYMLNRRILYTAITRARKNVYLYVIGDALKIAISNQSENHRYSNLFAHCEK